MNKLYTLAAMAFLLGADAFSQCINTHNTSVASPNVCYGDSTTINLDSSEDSVLYWVRDQITMQNYTPPIHGDGNPLSYNTGTLTQNKSYSYSGHLKGGALDFDGADDYVALANMNFSGGDKLTIEAWVYPTDLTAISGRDIVRQKGAGANDFALAFSNTGAVIQFEINTGANTQLQYSISPGNYINKWTHIAGVYDGVNMLLYVNGELKTSTPKTGNLNYDAGSAASFGNDPFSFLNHFQGKIDEVRLWNTGRTSSQINANMYRELEGGESGIVAYWNLDDGTGSATAAAVVGGNNGTLTNMDPASDWVYGAIGMSINYGALDFDGIDDYVSALPTDLSGGDKMTMETWVYPRDITTNSDYYIVTQEDIAIPDFWLNFSSNGTVLSFNNGAALLNVAINAVDYENKWTHIAVIYDGVNIKMYANGIQIGSIPSSGNVNYSPTSTFSIGAYAGGFNRFDGLIDEVRIWDYDRTVEELQNNMFYKFTSQQNGLIGYWTFDDGPGSSTAMDGSPSMNNGTLINMDPPSDWVGGIVRGDNCNTMMNGFANVNVTGSGSLAFSPADSTMICPGSNVNFSFNGFPYDSLLWNFGDGQTGMWNYVPHTYNDTGTYTVKMWVYSNMCGWDSTTQTIFVDTSAAPVFSINGSNQACPNDAVSFTSSAPLSSYLWVFDGTDSLTNVNPAYTWTATGTYTVVLEGTNNCGNASQDTIFVNVNNSVTINANLNFWSNPSCPLEPVNFSNNNNDPGAYWWYFGDGDSSNAITPIHYYADTGMYFPTLIVTNSCGNSDTAFNPAMPLTIQYDTTDIPYANFRFDINGPWPGPDTLTICPGQIIVFENTSNGNQGASISYLWDFGDGTSTSSYDATHQFDSINTFTVKLIATNLCGGKDTATKWVIVNPFTTPGSSLAIFPFDPLIPNNVSICPDETVLFFDDNAPFNNYLYSIWFGDGDSLINVMQNNSDTSFGVGMHAYQDTGIYNYIFISTNTCGNNDTLTGTITVDTVSNGMTFIFHDAEDILNPACPGDEIMFWTINGISVVWNFGDGSPIDSGDVSQQGHQAFHAYSAVGTYTAMAIITNGCGGTDTAYSTVYINNNNLPDPWFDSDQPNWTSCAGEIVNFMGGLNGGGNENSVSFFWDFDDGATDSVRNPSHLFNTPGSYFIELTATNGCGSKTTNRTLTVRNVIINETSLSITNSACNDSTGSITGLMANGVPPFTYIWNNANGDPVGDSANVNNQPAGLYTLYAYDLAGCWDTSGSHQILNNGAPVAPSAPSPLPYCQGDVIADLTATAGSGGVLKWYSDPALNDSIYTGSPFASGASGDSSFYVTETVGNCESPYTQVNVTVNPVYQDTVYPIICNGDSVLAQGAYQKITGTYYDSLPTVNGCDSVWVTILTVNPTYFNSTAMMICSGDSIFLASAYQTTSGTYYDSLLTVNGCDSIIETPLTVNPTYNIPVAAAICSGDSILLGGSYQMSAGTYYDTLSTMMSCDSVIATTLTVNPTYTVPASASICSGDSILLSGSYQMSAGTYYDTLSTVMSCDSVIATTLIVNPTYTVPAAASICSGDSMLLGGSYQTSAGTYYDTLSTMMSCDSVIATTLTIRPSYTGSMSTFVSASICSGDSILLGGSYQMSAGMYYDTLSTVMSCDSVIATTLIVNPTYNIPASASICSGDSILLGGSYQTSAGTYYDTLATVMSCDSVIATTLIVNPSYSVPVSVSICSGDSIKLGGAYQTAAGTYYDSLATGMSCDSVIVTTLIINPSYTGSMSTFISASICSGDSILLGGSYQTSAGTYYDTLSTALSCDSVIATTLTVNPTYTVPASASICLGDSILLGGSYQTSAGTYYDTLSTALSCDSVIATTLTVTPLPTINISPSPGVVCTLDDTLTFTANGATTYAWAPSSGLNTITGSTVMAFPTSAMTYTVTGTSSGGCINSSAVNYQLSAASVVASFTSATNACTGSPVVFSNMSTNATGYSWSFEGGTTADTTIQNPSVIYTTAGTYDVTLIAYGCGGDSTLMMTNYMTVNTSYSSSTNTTICSNDSVLFGGVYVNSSGVYYDSLLTTSGCDSIMILNLTVNPAYSSSSSITICTGDSIMAGGTYQTSSGTYYDSLLTVSGCDSVLITNLTVNPAYLIPVTVMICPGDSAKIAGVYQSIPGTYNESFTAANGCDSIITTTLAFYSPPVVSVDPSPGVVCAYGDTVSYSLSGAASYNWLTLPSSMNVNGDSAEVWSPSDTNFMVVGMSADGCADTATVSYVLNSGGAVASFTSNVTSVCKGGSVMFSSTSTNATGRTWAFSGGTPSTSLVQNPVVTYTATGNYDVTLTAFGCGGDSAITMTNYITVNAPVSGSTAASICSGDSILLGGSYQTGAGTYYDTLASVNGCDSIVTTTLSIKNNTSSSQTVTACDSYNWNSNIYTVSGTFIDTIPNTAGCDSVMTLDLTINYNTSSTQTVTACDSYIWNGNTYTFSGTYMDTIPNTAGCDSVMTLDLTINYNTSSTQTVTACDSYIWNGNTYTSSGTYMDTIPNAMNCDSLMTLNLTINLLPSVTLILNPDTVCSTAGTYTLTGGTPGSGIYSGAGVSAGNFDPAVAGTGSHTITYAFTDGNGCTDSTMAQIVVELCTNIGSAIGTHISIVIVPNPNHGQFHLQTNKTLSGKIKIYNALGEIVYESDFHNTDIDLSNKPAGIYFFEFISNEKVTDRQLIIKD